MNRFIFTHLIIVIAFLNSCSKYGLDHAVSHGVLVVSLSEFELLIYEFRIAF